jgi:hypothetical protein
MLLASCFFFLVFLLLALAACNDFLALAAGNSSSDALPLLQAGSADNLDQFGPKATASES